MEVIMALCQPAFHETGLVFLTPAFYHRDTEFFSWFLRVSVASGYKLRLLLHTYQATAITMRGEFS